VKKFFLFFLLLTVIVHSQPKHPRDGFPNIHQLKPTVILTPKSGSIIIISYLYRIPYNLVVFEKEGSNFKASIRIMVEILKDKELVARDVKDKKITVDNFEITTSKAATIEGFINFNLEADEYLISGIITDLNSGKEIRLFPENIRGTENIEEGIFNPIIINLAESNCNGKNLPLIVNYGGSIPYSSQDYQLVIPIADTTVEKLSLELRNNNNEPILRTVTETYITEMSPVECNGKLFIGKNNESQKTKNFILRDFSQKLNEGILLLNVKISDDGESHDFPIPVVWLEKPISLRNPEFAIEMLKYIEDENELEKLLDADTDEYQMVLHNYWRKYDPTPDTEYNEIMDEYYSRIDYAALEFKGLSKKNGISTDRGKVYIRYGKPDNIERSSNEFGYVVETWFYSNPKQKFVFVDKQGTGNFILMEG